MYLQIEWNSSQEGVLNELILCLCLACAVLSIGKAGDRSMEKREEIFTFGCLALDSETPNWVIHCCEEFVGPRLENAVGSDVHALRT